MERTSTYTPYVKFIQSGNVIEVYEMQKKPYNKADKDKEFSSRQTDKQGYEQSVLQNLRTDIKQVSKTIQGRNRETIKEAVNNTREMRKLRKDERRGQTLRDGKNKVRRLALANFTEEDWLVTLTYADNFQDVKEADKHLKAFIRKLRKYYPDLKYLAVREFQKRGAIHFHILMDYPFLPNIQYGENGFIDALMERERHYGELWGHGWVDLQTLKRSRSKKKQYEGKAVDNVGAYIAKYMNKSADDERLKGHKLFLTSRNLEKPIVLTEMEAIVTLDILELHTKKETFTNCYESEYLGKIIYKEYNMTRLKEQQLIDKESQTLENNDIEMIDTLKLLSYNLGELPIIFEEE